MIETKYEDVRQERGYNIFKTSKIFFDEKRNGWIVPSQNSNKKYFVSKNSHDFECDCPDCQFRNVECKHTHAVKYYLQVEKENSEGETETEKIPLTYKQAWKAYNDAQTNEVRQFDKLLSDLVQNIEEPEQKRGRGRPSLSLKEQVFCSVQKVYSQLSSRRASSLFSFAEEREQISHAPHFNAVSKFLNREEAKDILEELLGITAQVLKTVETDFAIDASGFRTTNFHEYNNQKHNGSKKEHNWLKAHLCVGVKTNIITGIVITRGQAGDSPQFEPLVRWASRNGFHIDEVSADMAYSSRNNLEVVEELGGTPYIPFKKNATGRAKGKPIWKKMFHYFQYNQEEFLEHYHKRSNVETAYHMIKSKFGDTLKSKNPLAQRNELLCKAIAHNIVVLIHEMRELGIEPNFTNSDN